MGKLSVALGILVLCAAGSWGRFTARSVVACLKPGHLVIVLPVISQNPRTFCIPRVCDFPGKLLGGGAGSLKPRRRSQIQSTAQAGRALAGSGPGGFLKDVIGSRRGLVRYSRTGCGKFIFSTYAVFGSGYWFVMEALGCGLGSVLRKQKVRWRSLQGR